MFLKILINYLLGYVNISVEGYFIERFMNSCISKKIFLWSSKREKSTILHTNIGMKDFKRLKPIAKKTKCRIKINRKKGLPYLMNKYKKRKIFAIFLFIVFFSLIGLSNFVWNIEVKGQENIPEEELRRNLEEEGLKLGCFKPTIDTKQIINNIRLKRDDIAWLGINMEGTNVIVEIKEMEKKPEIIDANDYCNIVSDKEGVITKINVQNGTAIAKVGDVVKKGSPLVVGWLEGKYTGTRYVHAIADVEAKVWYAKKEKVSMNQVVPVKTGKEEKKYSIQFNKFKINLYKTLSKFENYDTINENKKLMLFTNFYLPIELVTTTNYEYTEQEINYTEQELTEITVQKLEKELQETIDEEKNIVNKQVNTNASDGYIEVEVIYEVQESIGTQEKIIF